MSARRAGALAVGVALIVVAVWFARLRSPRAESIAEATIAVHVTRHDAYGAPSKPVTIRDRARVQAIVDALGADAQPAMTCPPDYAAAEVGVLLTGRDVYARRNAYVWSLATEPRVVVVDSTGCRGGPVVDAGGLRRALAVIDAGFPGASP